MESDLYSYNRRFTLRKSDILPSLSLLDLLIRGVFGWLILGAIQAWGFSLPKELLVKLLRWGVVSICLPCLFASTISIHLKPADLPSLLQWALWGLGMAVLHHLGSRIAARVTPIPEADVGAFHLGNTFFNYAFMAYPIVGSLCGPVILAKLFALTLTMDILMWSWGPIMLGKGKSNPWKCLLNPPLVGMLVGVLTVMTGGRAMSSMPWQWLDYFAKLAVPLGLVGIGGLLYHNMCEYGSWRDMKDRRVLVPLALCHIILPPLLIMLVFFLSSGAMSKALWVEAVMPMALMPLTLAAIHGVSLRFLGLAATLSTLLSVLTIPLWLGLALQLL